MASASSGASPRPNAAMSGPLNVRGAGWATAFPSPAFPFQLPSRAGIHPASLNDVASRAVARRHQNSTAGLDEIAECGRLLRGNPLHIGKNGHLHSLEDSDVEGIRLDDANAKLRRLVVARRQCAHAGNPSRR